MDAKELLGALSDEELSTVVETIPQELESRGMTLPVADSLVTVEPETKEFVERIAKINDISEEEVIVGALSFMMTLSKLGLKRSLVTYQPWCEDETSVRFPYSLKPLDEKVGPSVIGFS